MTNPIPTTFDPLLYTNATVDFHRQELVSYKTLSKQGIYLNKLKIKLIKALGSDCRMCGHRRKLEFAHVRRTKLCGKTGRGKCKRLYDIKNNLSSYILLCKRPCHLEFDRTHKFKHVTYSKYKYKTNTLGQGIYYD